MAVNKLGELTLSDLVEADASLASVKAISLTDLESLASMRDHQRRLSVIARIQRWDSDIGTSNSLNSVALLRQLMALEDQIETVISSDKNWFFQSPDEVAQTQFAIDLDLYHLSAAQTYQRLIERRADWGLDEIDALLHSAVAFAIHHYGSAIKWGYLRHQTVRPTIWTDLHKLYRLAEQENFVSLGATLFNPEAGVQTTANALYIRALMLDFLNSGNLSMPQVEIADGWLTEWSHQYALEHEFNAVKHILYVNLDAPSGLLRTGKISPNDAFRYLRLNRLDAQISLVQSALLEGRPYQGSNSATSFPVAEYAGLLAKIEQLHQTLLQPDAPHLETRTEVTNRIAVVCFGFGNVLKLVNADALAASAAAATDLAPDAAAADAISLKFDASTHASSESVRIQDVSPKGIGLIVNNTRGEQTPVGEIMLVKPEGQGKYRLAIIVRKLTQRNQAEMLLGVELLSLRPLPITLHCMDANDSNHAKTLSALFAPGAEKDGRLDMLILDTGDFVPRQPYAIKIQNVLYAIRINRVVHNQPGWVGLRFEVTSKS